MDTAPIVGLFNQLMTVGLALGAVVCAFFLMLAGYQWMTAGDNARGQQSARGSLVNALIGLAIVALSKVLANLVAAALGAPQAS
jgi:hypothetical protein